MKQKRVVFYALLVALAMLLCACSQAGTTTSPTPLATEGTNTSIALEGAGLTLSLNVEDLKAREQVTIDTTNVDSNGEVAEVTGSGVSLYTLLEESGVQPADLTSVTFTASDGYIMTVPQDILSAREVYILFEMNGDALGAPRSAIPEERAMYWVRDLIKIEISVEGDGGADASKVVLFNTAAAAIESETLNNRGEDAISTSLDLFCQTYLKAAPEGFVTMTANDGFEKQEKADTFLTCYVTLEGEDTPLYFSETLADGMRVKQLLLVASDDEVIYFGQTTVSMADLVSTCNLAEGASYEVLAADGFSLSVTTDELMNGSLQYADGTITAVFPDVVKAGGNVKDVVSITVVE